MLREVRARWVAVLTVLLVVVLAALFSQLRQLRGGPGAAQSTLQPAAPQPVAPQRAAPRAATRQPATPAAVPVAPPVTWSDDVALREFARLGCAACHSIAGRGNPAKPLDGIGARRDAASIREWAGGTGAAADELSASVLRRKAGAATDPALPALAAWLAARR
ncbi:MAG: c-type cytochrome [Steroidobacteraceae bacterium]